MSFEPARRVADAVLLEGYVLYPYRASAVKNQVRWQFGVLAPPEAATGEPSSARTECLIEAEDAAVLEVRVRFLRVRARVPEGTGAAPEWDEGELHEIDAALDLAGDRTEGEFPLSVAESAEEGHPGGGSLLQGRALDGVLTVAAQRLDGPGPLTRVRVCTRNRTPWRHPAGDRADMLRSSMVAAHLLLRVRGGAFLSLLDPPDWAASAAASCTNQNTWPVLVGEPGRRDLMLSAPIILYDHPRIAPESPADLCDATEIDEILTLRTMTLTEEEKRQARATDERAARIVDGAETIPAETLERLHGALRYVEQATAGDFSVPARATEPVQPGTHTESAGSARDARPGSEKVAVRGGTAAAGSRVLLRPGRRADAQDMFLHGCAATVAGVFPDVDGESHVAVILDDDPGADLNQWYGRYLYFAPDEVELREDDR